MYLVDTNIFLEILLSQDKAQQCKEILKTYSHHIYVSDFSLHSIGVILFRHGKEDIFQAFVKDIIFKTKIVTLLRNSYNELSAIKKKYGLDFDDAYQFTIAQDNNFILITMDKDFDKVKDIIKVNNI